MKSNIFVFTFLLFSFFGFAQNYELSGKVVDSKTGEVLLGVNIINSETCRRRQFLIWRQKG